MAFPRFLAVVTIDSTNDVLRFDEGGGNLTATLTQGEYFIRGGGAAASDLLAQIKTQLDAAGGQVYTVAVSSTGSITISAAGNFSLHWNTGPADTQRIAAILGFLTAADDAGAATYTSDLQHTYGWFPERHLLDGRRRFETATAGSSRSLGHQQYTQQWETDYRAVARIDFVPVDKVRYADVEGTGIGAIGQAFTSSGSASWDGFYELARQGLRFEFHPDVATIAAMTAVIDPAEADWFEDVEAAAELLMEAGERYRILVPMRPYQA